MLQHYSPYKVAENFNLLAALGRGRVDLGVGKAPGGLPLSTKALQQEIDSAKRLDFNGKLAQLSAFLGGERSDPARLRGWLLHQSLKRRPNGLFLEQVPKALCLPRIRAGILCMPGI